MRLTIVWPLLLLGGSCATGRGEIGISDGRAAAAIERGLTAEQNETRPAQRAQRDLELAKVLQGANLPFAASLYDAAALKEGSGPAALEAASALAELEPTLNDPYLVPTLLAKRYQGSWKELPAGTLGEINYLVATTHQRSQEFAKARALLQGVPLESPVYAKARYLTGVIDADPRFEGGRNTQKALEDFEEVLNIKNGRQQDLRKVQQLAILAKGRVLYGLGQYQQALAYYDKIPRFSQFWDQALFESAFARFRSDNYGGALGALKSLHAPQFEGAFQPESWVLEAIVLHFACLFEESKNSFAEFENVYMPMAKRIQPLVEGPEGDYATYLGAISNDSQAVPKAIRLWIRNNDRVRGLLDLLAEIDRENQSIRSMHGLSPGTTSQLTERLSQNRTILAQAAGKLVKSRLTEAYQTIRKLHSDGDLIRLETTLAEKRQLEVGTDQKKVLADQVLHRPAMPSDMWDYWNFQGEYWIDEIGYYQYTLKRGCVQDGPATAAPNVTR